MRGKHRRLTLVRAACSSLPASAGLLIASPASPTMNHLPLRLRVPQAGSARRRVIKRSRRQHRPETPFRRGYENRRVCSLPYRILPSWLSLPAISRSSCARGFSRAHERFDFLQWLVFPRHRECLPVRTKILSSPAPTPPLSFAETVLSLLG